MTVVVCPGSFDPITLGHVDVISRARDLFGEVIVGVAKNASKSALLSVEDRLLLAEDAVKDLSGVTVQEIPGLLVEFCEAAGATAVIKGLRNGADLDAELPMALMNRHLTGLETIFIPASPGVAHIASSMVKDVARHGGTIDDLVTELTARTVRSHLRNSHGL